MSGRAIFWRWLREDVWPAAMLVFGIAAAAGGAAIALNATHRDPEKPRDACSAGGNQSAGRDPFLHPSSPVVAPRGRMTEGRRESIPAAGGAA